MRALSAAATCIALLAWPAVAAGEPLTPPAPTAGVVRSDPSPEVAVPIAPLAARVAVRLREPSGVPRACPGMRQACVVETTRASRLELRGDPALELAGTAVEIDVLHRAPGARVLRRAGQRRFTLAPGEVGAGAPLAAIARRSGTWCVVATRLVDAPDLSLVAEPPTCVRFRPPVELGWAGDIVIGSHYGLPPNGGRDQFELVATLLRAPSLMIGNYEGTLPIGADDGTHTRAAAHAAIDAGADVVFGSGPHVVRGVERWRGRYIVYSSGNFAGWRNFGGGGLLAQSGVVRMTFDHRGRPLAAAWEPVLLRGPGIPHRDRGGSVIRRVASLSRADFGTRGARFRRDGSFR